MVTSKAARTLVLSTLAAAGLGSAKTIAELNGDRFKLPATWERVEGIRGIVTAKSFDHYWITDPERGSTKRSAAPDGIYIYGAHNIRWEAGSAIDLKVKVGQMVEVNGTIVEPGYVPMEPCRRRVLCSETPDAWTDRGPPGASRTSTAGLTESSMRIHPLYRPWSSAEIRQSHQ